MRAHAVGLDERELLDTVTSSWELDVVALTYEPKGGGSYHWLADSSDATRYFLTADDLDAKPWLGDDRESVFVGLRRAFDTAETLRTEVGCTFVVAPLQTREGSTLARVSPRYSAALFPFLVGQHGDFFKPLAPHDRMRLLQLLAQLHSTPRESVPGAAVLDLDLAGRLHLETALRDVGEPWPSGPHAEPARALLAAKLAAVSKWLDTFDRLRSRVSTSGGDLVVTHGEPHPGNLMMVDGELFLIDWDTVGIAPAERDLWMLDDRSAGGPGAYTDLTGRAVDPDAVELYRLTWTLADLASYFGVLRAEHDDSADTRHALHAISTYLTSEGGA